MNNTPPCRACGSRSAATFVDLGMSPLANSYVPANRQDQSEIFYPLHAFVCKECFLVQLPAFTSAESIFSEYSYFSSYSDSWLAHCRNFTGAIAERLNLGPQSQVVEVASNDGYLLQFFKERNIPVLGIEPAANVAAAAQAKGIATEICFFGRAAAVELRQRGITADLMVANNVLAHTPEINDFVAGFRELLKPDGVAVFEFPSLERQISGNQFDTIYHEHFSYLSLLSAEKIFRNHKLRVFDVEVLKTHGGSLRLYVAHAGSIHIEANTVARQRTLEDKSGLKQISTYEWFSEAVIQLKAEILEFFLRVRSEKKTVVGYGAPAKGNTLLNYCGIGREFLQFTVDRSPHKQGTLLPGTRIPVLDPKAIIEAKPDYVFILPWNLREEITEQMKEIRSWGAKFVVPIPTVEVF